MAKHIEVSIAVIVNADGNILLSQRRGDVHQPNLWEFPGGKIERSETAQQALSRELREELGIDVTGFRSFICLTHEYSDLTVTLNVFRVIAWNGEVKAIEQQPLLWVSVNDLSDYPLPSANKAIVCACRLSPCCAISPASLLTINSVLEWAKRAVHKGAGMLLIRLPSWEQSNILVLLEEMSPLFVGTDIAIFLSSRHYTNDCAQYLDGVQMTSKDMRCLDARDDFPSHLLLGASCHDQQEIERAKYLKLDYLFLSPVKKTASHPDVEALGWDTFERWISDSGMPIYALGGVDLNSLGEVWEYGGHGIAAISAFR